MTAVVARAEHGLEQDEKQGSDFAGLCRQVRAAQLLDRARLHYAIRISATVGFFAACWAVTAWLGSSWLVLIPAALLGIASTQFGFLGHDGAHQQITASRTGNTVIGMIAGDLLTGLSIGWWVDKHNRHHANPNREDYDPDIGEGVLVFTGAHAEKRTSGVSGFIARHQASLFFPLLTLEGINLHVASIQWLQKSKNVRFRRRAHPARRTGVIYVSALLLIMSPLQALAFIAVHQAVWGVYMGCSFAPNHKGMLLVGAHEKLDFLRKQVVTSRNVRGGWFTDLLLGGLNYQIEHHLFPSMPRPHLRRAQLMVRSYCADQEILYTETGLIESYAIALRYLHELGRPLRAARARI